MSSPGSAATPPVLDVAALRAAGRHPPVPFCVRLPDGRMLTLLRLLRVLPGKRIVGEASVDGSPVLAKLFVGRGAARHWRRECDGIAALRAAGIATAEPLCAARLTAGGYALLTHFLAHAQTLDEAWARLSSAPGEAYHEALGLLAPALAMLARMHQAGLVQDDLHLGNFLLHEGRLLVIDGDAVRAITPARALDEPTATRNLAILLAQLPVQWDARRAQLLAAYRAGRAQPSPDARLLQREIERLRMWRLKTWLAKTVRDCTHFSVGHSARRFIAMVRGHAEVLTPIVASPDRAMADAALLKDGRTATVAHLQRRDAKPLVIKRYNRKNLIHALSRLWRPSRAWHSWREAHRLIFLGIDTPAPLALVEERLGPLRGRAWLITEQCPGPNLLAHLDPGQAPAAAEAHAILTLFETFVRERISHGDLKATNLLWHEQRIFVIDLDAMMQHRSDARFVRQWRRDRARLLRNWPADSALHHWLDVHLPGIGTDDRSRN